MKALLPEAGSDIKGHMRSRHELLAACGLASRPKDFDELLHILDAEIRLITPTDPEGKDDPGEPGGVSPRSADTKYYQLTHMGNCPICKRRLLLVQHSWETALPSFEMH